MSDRWGAVDQLIRELGGLRAEATEILHGGRPLEAAVAAAVEQSIRQAADAVDRTIDGDDDEVLIQAWEAVLLAQNSLAAVRGTAERSRVIVARSQDLRKRAAELMVDSLRLRGNAAAGTKS